jgi:hypothetical protein
MYSRLICQEILRRVQTAGNWTTFWAKLNPAGTCKHYLPMLHSKVILLSSNLNPAGACKHYLPMLHSKVILLSSSWSFAGSSSFSFSRQEFLKYATSPAHLFFSIPLLLHRSYEIPVNILTSCPLLRLLSCVHIFHPAFYSSPQVKSESLGF